MNTTIKFLNKTPFLKLLSGIVLIICGIYLLISPSFFGLLFIIAGLSLLVKTGTEIDIENKKYRDLFSFIGFSIGTWKPLPKIEYISIFNAKLKVKAGITIEHEFKDSIYRILLFHNTNQKIIVYETKNKQEAIKYAKFLADFLKTDILDATSADSKWLD